MYLAYYESVEGSGFVLHKDLEKLKGEWCITMRIFETPDLTQEELSKIKRPILPRVKNKYKLVHSEGVIMHGPTEEELNIVKAEERDIVIEKIIE